MLTGGLESGMVAAASLSHSASTRWCKLDFIPLARLIVAKLGGIFMVTGTRSQAPPPDLDSTFHPAVVEPRSREDALIGVGH